MTEPQMVADRPVPAGMRRLPFDIGFIAGVGPLWGRLDSDGAPVMGFRVEPRHANPGEVCHGGMLMTFADMLLGMTVSVATGGRKFLPTVNLSGDFVGPAPIGSWVEGKGRLLRTTRNLGYGDALITADGEPCLRVSGIMKIPAQDSRLGDIRLAFG